MTIPPARLEAFPAGTVLAREGRPVLETVLIVEGRAAIRACGARFGELVRGDLLVAVPVSSSTVVAETDMRVAIVPASPDSSDQTNRRSQS